MIEFVTINLDKPRRLRFGFGAMAEYDRLTGGGLLRDRDQMTMDEYAKALWVMLKREEPDITIEQVYDLVDDNCSSIYEVIGAINEAISLAVNYNEGETKNAKAPKSKKD